MKPYGLFIFYTLGVYMNKLLEIQCKAFLKALNNVKQVVPIKSTIVALEHIKITLGEKCSIQATDISMHIESIFTPQWIEGEFIALLPYKKLLDVIRSFSPDSIVTLYKLENGTKFIVQCEDSTIRLTGLSNSEFPEYSGLNMQPSTDVISLNETETSLMMVAHKYCSKDEYRPALTGVCFSFEGHRNNQLTIAATDGYCLYLNETLHFHHESLTYIIPSNAINAICGKTCTIQFLKDYAVLKSNEQTITVKLIDGAFPVIRNVIPTTTTNQATLNRKELLNAIQRSAMFAPNNSPQIVLHCASSSTTIFAENTESGGAAEVKVHCKHDFQQSFVIGFNSSYLKEIVSSFSDEKITLYFNAPDKAVVVNGQQHAAVTALIMPMRLTSEVVSLVTEVPTPKETTKESIISNSQKVEQQYIPQKEAFDVSDQDLVLTLIELYTDDSTVVRTMLSGDEHIATRVELLQFFTQARCTSEQATVEGLEQAVKDYIELNCLSNDEEEIVPNEEYVEVV